MNQQPMIYFFKKNVNFFVNHHVHGPHFNEHYNFYDAWYVNSVKAAIS